LSKVFLSGRFSWIETPLSSNVKYANDPYYGPAFYNNDHDAGSDWLTADNAVAVGKFYGKTN
jgi:hypothetical protein